MSPGNQTRVLLLQALYQLSCLPSPGFSLDFSFQINKMQCYLWAAQSENVALNLSSKAFLLQKTETFTESYHWSKGREQPTMGHPTPNGMSITQSLHLKCHTARGGVKGLWEPKDQGVCCKTVSSGYGKRATPM